jgi:hypothetical protein
MVFSTSRTAENVHFLYNEKEIETVTEFNYLGITFTKNGKFKVAKQKNIPVIFLSSINCSRSFKNTANKKGDKFSPCLMPTSLEKKSDLLSL